MACAQYSLLIIRPIGTKRGVLDLSEWSCLRVAGLLSVDSMGLVDADDCIAQGVEGPDRVIDRVENQRGATVPRRHIGEGDRDGRVGQLQSEFEISFHAPGYASPTRGRGSGPWMMGGLLVVGPPSGMGVELVPADAGAVLWRAVAVVGTLLDR